MDIGENHTSWASTIRRYLLESKEWNLFFFSFGNSRSGLHRVCQDDLFLVSLFFSSLTKNFDLVCSLYYLWKIKAPPRVIAFGWVALRGNILTQDNLHHRKMVMVNACPTCLSAKEAVDLFLIIRSLKKFGDRCLAGLGAVGFSTFPNWSFSSLKIFYWLTRARVMWRVFSGCYLDHFWKNQRLFDNNSSSIEAVNNKIKYSIVSWVSILPQFWSFPSNLIWMNWREVVV